MAQSIEQDILKEIPHFEEKRFCVTTLRRRPKAIWDFASGYGHFAIITKRGKDDCVIVSLETYLLMTQFATDEKTLQHRADVIELIRQREEKKKAKEKKT